MDGSGTPLPRHTPRTITHSALYPSLLQPILRSEHPDAQSNPTGRITVAPPHSVNPAPPPAASLGPLDLLNAAGERASASSLIGRRARQRDGQTAGRAVLRAARQHPPQELPTWIWKLWTGTDAAPPVLGPCRLHVPLNQRDNPGLHQEPRGSSSTRKHATRILPSGTNPKKKPRDTHRRPSGK